MSRPRLYKTEVIVIRGADLGEADRLLTLFTPQWGKLRAVARGARRPRSKLGGHLEVLTHSLIMLAQGRQLDVITQSQTIHSFLPLRQDLSRLSLALYAADLVDSFTEERMENQSLFRLLLDTLEWLGVASGELPLRHFELHLLECLGYRPQLQRCVSCDSTLEPRLNYFSPGAGGVVCPACRGKEAWVRPLPPNALKVLRFLQASPQATARRLRLNPEMSLEIKRHLQSYICYLLEREVKSATWLDRLTGVESQRASL